MSLSDLFDLGHRGMDSALLFGIFWRLGNFKATVDGFKKTVEGLAVTVADHARRLAKLEAK